VALGIASHRIAADAEGLTLRDIAAHVAVPGQSRTLPTAAVAVAPTEVTVDVASAGRLTDEDARGGVGRAQSAAARATAVAHRAMDAAAAVGGAARRGLAGAEPAGIGHVADAAAAIGRARADVAGLNAVRRGELANAVRAELGAALGVLLTRV